ncbi:divinyl protochlorophyllide a 8-vinyl-reductase [Rhodoblastus acidophilus]|uniref:Divinyl protochlorophyllide a 8-vinyl-reductase n=2 Tax=Rhodoblastus acidophilus TaxID=1074 RepID=A0A212S0U6_RHOAC|nr:bacteriochlorophyll 4-vinyl reductase [Rhodoblastus acidophilus]PPQ38219.1 bacteriochlorophyll 4-vinyl reductase [Rhodoblastus acidophilus]SNB78738.1 divinyl protochlorophyllide a 8-vinyl-reductase [Rhodoblastus acidophilus]
MAHPTETERSGHIGPNAVIQLIAALKALGETEAMTRLFTEADRLAWIESPPSAMIPADEAARLHIGLRGVLPKERAEAALALAGRLTADYLLANRIPRPAQFILKILPAPLAARVLMRAISANAWTFAGSAGFSYALGAGVEARIRDNPLCEGLQADAPACVWHAAVFEGLFQALVSPKTRATETTCCANGDDCCRFQLRWN